VFPCEQLDSCDVLPVGKSQAQTGVAAAAVCLVWARSHQEEWHLLELVQRACKLVAKRFQRSEVDTIELIGHDVGPISGILMGAACGNWQPSDVTLIDSKCAKTQRFSCGPSSALCNAGTFLFQPLQMTQVRIVLLRLCARLALHMLLLSASLCNMSACTLIFTRP
jgi:hypothetical protein